MTTSLAELRARLPGLMPRDQYRLGRRADKAAALRDAGARENAFRGVLAELEAAADRVKARRLAVPPISYPPELPVSQRRDEIAEAIRDNQVVIIAGETGSGKTTQLPKICLELGRGVTGQIGHTQPRRIAARTVAERIAQELRTGLGAAVGYKVRFADTSSDSTLVKVMTDGILLTEMRRDRRLLRYDTLIIDEAHERSLNVDFILGYLRRLLPSRPDLKIIITSATIDPERFSKHFAAGKPGQLGAGGEPGQLGAGGEPGQQRPAPVIEVSGRTYPVEVRYRPLADTRDPDDEPTDQVQAICGAVDELRAAGPGDILVFLSGEREIRDTADALAGGTAGDLEVLPLYARLSAAEQHRVFEPHRGRRVVLATNVAETSLTVPGIKYVIDPGTARISRYSHRTKVQRLPIEPISQASANQRKGRCGRTSDGVCIRLYSEEDFASRPQFTDPEILRTNLASVILRMAALDLGEVADFPFVDPPESRNVADGVRLLDELGAVSRGRGRLRLTDTGRKLAELPVDPRLGRMILESGRNGCAREALIITAALSIQDPRERPVESRETADAMHARFAEPASDFLAFLSLWDYLRDRQRELSASAFRRMCRREYLHYQRVREWQDVYGQLGQAARDLGIVVGPDHGRPAVADPDGAAPGRVTEREAGEARFPTDLADRLHMSLLAGLLSHIGMKDTDQKPRGKRSAPAEFAGARGTRFAIFPGSALARKPPQWVVAAELAETSRLWARTTARIKPEWVEPLAPHLVRRTYSEPRWDGRRGVAMAAEKVTLYGLPVVAARQVNYGRIDPVAARDLFIRGALVEGDWQTHHRFFHHNRRLLEEAEDLERRARRRGIVADDAALFDFYDRRIPKDVTSARHFDSWWKRARAADPSLLNFSPADLVGPSAEEIRPADYPSRWGELAVSYEFAPGEAGDGVTVDIPLATLNQTSAEEFGWQVPGLREDLVTELIRSLPKQLRRAFVPAPDAARAAVARLGSPHGDLLEALGSELGRLGGVKIPREAWDLSRLPAHLRITFRIVDSRHVLATGKDLDELRQQLRPRMEAMLTEAARGVTRSGIRNWDLGALPRVFTDGQVRAYPALADAGDAVDVRLFDTESAASEAMWRGTRRLVLIQVPSGVRSAASRLSGDARLAMSRHPYPSATALLEDCAACAADEVIAAAGGPVWDAEGFAHLIEATRSALPAATIDVVSAVARVLAEAHDVELTLGRATSPVLAPTLADMRDQLSALIHPGFVAETGSRRLPDVVRYLRAISRRLEKAPEDPGRDADRLAVVRRVTDAYQRAIEELPAPGRRGEQVRAVRWMIEELRVSLFAQALGTPAPVSEQRIRSVLDHLT
ncbi:MAG TPA: ATP-dependent RNA helicase HrpA [Streptosporangiaceae bacterium]|nr:ATP-dependent RNA helicase HrpA [Streptosporangiaceae bacterium]